MNRYDYPSVGETMYSGVLSNGLRLSVITKPGYTRCFAMFATDYGAADRRFRLGGEYIDTPAGVAHFLEHKMFDMPDGDNALAKLASNGAQPNAYTASGITAYYFESTSNFYANLEMLLKFVSTPYFTEESVAKEQGIIGQEIRMCEDNPDYVIYDELMRCLYEHHPIRESVAGTVESISHITPEILYSCHKIFYNPSNMCLCVVGDVDPARVEAAAESILPSEAGELPERSYGPAEGPRPAKERYSRAMEVSAPQFLLGAKLSAAPKGPGLLRQKLVGSLALSCLFGQSSPFYNELYGAGLLNTDFSTGMDYSAGTLTVMAGGESRSPEEVFRRMMDELRRAAVSGLDPDLWSRVKKASYGARIRALSSFSGLCSSMADGAFGSYNCLDSFAAVEQITAEETRLFIADQLVPERFAMSVITPLSRKEVDE